ncbi:MAG: 30S ribosomal protein S16 [Bacteroidia bacterium]|nr:30S ribosomal protein S16 [Bacteroidia bacterium]QQR95059.1 MAG: 30S ribosomal protein S16 [Bacteroidota bacterium]MBP7714344.1 30S ribosomal protein S16 [Bacteroidia bacterium]HOZ89487.1 30S ribosomal protein S16 [Bacteroidia bacterium]HQW17627.1 30S ribosomal protein S16 [Bacteroidia bacterium]
MPTKIRLQRFGKKGQPFYHVVVADSRAPRDGKFIEKIGTYNPRTIPATIDLNLDRALYWLGTGAQPTETTRAILSYKGVLYKNHLMGGVKKGALTQEQADAKFSAWMENKNLKVLQHSQKVQSSKADDIKSRLVEESKKREVIAKAIAEKRAAANVAEAEAAAEAPATDGGETPAENA